MRCADLRFSSKIRFDCMCGIMSAVPEGRSLYCRPSSASSRVKGPTAFCLDLSTESRWINGNPGRRLCSLGLPGCVLVGGSVPLRAARLNVPCQWNKELGQDFECIDTRGSGEVAALGPCCWADWTQGGILHRPQTSSAVSLRNRPLPFSLERSSASVALMKSVFAQSNVLAKHLHSLQIFMCHKVGLLWTTNVGTATS